jgi:hypothetical protein
MLKMRKLIILKEIGRIVQKIIEKFHSEKKAQGEWV